MSGVIGGVVQGLEVRNYVWSTSILDWIAMTQPIIKTDTLTVSGTTDLTKYGGTVVGAANAIHVQPGTGASFGVTNAYLANLDIALSVVRDAITGSGVAAKTLANLATLLNGGLPSALGTGGGLKVDGSGTSLPVTATVSNASVYLIDRYKSTEVGATPNNELLIAPKIKICGAIAQGSTLDTNFWIKYESTGTVACTTSQFVVTSGTANNHYAVLQTVRPARWITGTTNKYRIQLRLSDGASLLAGLTRKWGVANGSSLPTWTDGAYFKLVGSTLSVCYMAGTSEVSTSTFNGSLGASYIPGANITTYEIEYTLAKIYFYVGGVLLHTVSTTTTHWTQNTLLYAFMECRNTDVTVATANYIRMMNIARMGELESEVTSGKIAGNAATYTFKYSAGKIHRIIYGNTTGTKISIYDAVSATGTPFEVTTASGLIGAQEFEWNFFTGLTIVTTGNGLEALVVYE